MIKIFKKNKARVYELKKISNGSWISLINPTEEEIEYISKKLKVPKDFLTSVLDEDEKPRIEKEDGVTLVVFRVPYKKYISNKLKITTLPIGIIITKKNIITICLKENKIIDDFTEGKIKLFSVDKRIRFTLQILARANHYFIKYLNDIEKEINKTEKSLMKSLRNKEIISLLQLEKILVYFNTSTVGNDNVLEKISKGKIINLAEEDEDILEDIIIETRQAILMSKIFSNILSSTMDAYTSVISNNLNIVMKFLASITIILSIPTIVASIYGMNVKLPLQTNPHAFFITLLISLILSGSLAYIFAKKNWL
ncbi:MAG: magnesium transporter CorA family protein [Candidatus Aenigmarchaeota archaeon]|nr:magnesium transporter CorA family protein [Candidatus Aenigmarchaeota archaeon]